MKGDIKEGKKVDENVKSTKRESKKKGRNEEDK
jgi:hypothetical protein